MTPRAIPADAVSMPAKKPRFSIRYHIQAAKPGISLAIALSALPGYLLHHPLADAGFYLCGISIFLLCAGSGGLNNCQDRYRDAELERTCKRALPRRRIPVSHVVIQSFLLIFLGLLGLGLSRQPAVTTGLGLLGVFLYNGAYTPLKRISSLAVIPGALCGMVPPLMGWTAAGGSALPPPLSIFSIMVVLGTWQLPHYWLILMAHQKNYQKCPLPTMLTLFSPSRLERILMVWVFLFATMTLMEPLFIPGLSLSACFLLGLNALGISGYFFFLFFKRQTKNYPLAFMMLNLSMGIFIAVLVLEGLARL